MPTSITISSVFPIRSPKIETVSKTSTSRLRSSDPQMNWIVLRSTSARPIDISSSWSIPAPALRIGRHMMRSSARPSTAVATTASSTPSTKGNSQVTFTRKAM